MSTIIGRSWRPTDCGISPIRPPRPRVNHPKPRSSKTNGIASYRRRSIGCRRNAVQRSCYAYSINVPTRKWRSASASRPRRPKSTLRAVCGRYTSTWTADTTSRGRAMGEVHRLPNAAEAQREASEWVVRLNADDVTDDDRARFEAWIDAHSCNAKAYADLSLTWNKLLEAGPLVRAVN